MVSEIGKEQQGVQYENGYVAFGVGSEDYSFVTDYTKMLMSAHRLWCTSNDDLALSGLTYITAFLPQDYVLRLRSRPCRAVIFYRTRPEGFAGLEYSTIRRVGFRTQRVIAAIFRI
jgi:hypothetical protein